MHLPLVDLPWRLSTIPIPTNEEDAMKHKHISRRIRRRPQVEPLEGRYSSTRATWIPRSAGPGR